MTDDRFKDDEEFTPTESGTRSRKRTAGAGPSPAFHGVTGRTVPDGLPARGLLSGCYCRPVVWLFGLLG
jgi:hypothetical protein